MAHLTNPLVSPEQLASSTRINDALPRSAQDLIRFSTARLTQAAGILLRLPQSVSAQAVVVLYRYWAIEELTRDEFKVAYPTESRGSMDTNNHAGYLSSCGLFNSQGFSSPALPSVYCKRLHLPLLLLLGFSVSPIVGFKEST